LRLVSAHEKRRNLGEPADRDHEADQHGEEPRVLLDRLEVSVTVLHRSDLPPHTGEGAWCPAGGAIGMRIASISLARANAAVCHMFQAITAMPPTIRSPPISRRT